ncbi:hypothetical protein M8494_04135 [Serratia ureilytica]
MPIFNVDGIAANALFAAAKAKTKGRTLTSFFINYPQIDFLMPLRALLFPPNQFAVIVPH